MTHEFSRLAQPSRIFGQANFFEPVVDSTNTWAKSAAGQGAAEGSLYIADSQTAGRGRGDHQWVSPAGLNLYFSLVLRPTIDPIRFSTFHLVVARSVHEALTTYLPTQERGRLKIKWPNDIVYEDDEGIFLKLGGILIEPTLKNNRFDSVVCGIGVNVNLQKLPDELAAIATSLSLVVGHPLDRVNVLGDILLVLEREYYKFLSAGSQNVVDYCNNHHALTTRDVIISSKIGATPREGRVIQILPNGMLEVRLSSGSLVELNYEEVSLKPR